MEGLLVTFEGTEGSGKTTQLIRLAAYLTKLGYSVVTTREPGGTRVGEQIRRLLLSTRTQRLDNRAELFLYLASRAQHVSERILPSIERGKIVLCDRFSDATLVYQGYGRALPKAFVKESINFAASRLIPNLTLLLDIDVDKGLRRIRRRGSANRMDQEGVKFHQQIRKGYLQIARAEPRRFRVIDANQDVHTVAALVNKTVSDFIEKRRVRLGSLKIKRRNNNRRKKVRRS